MDAPAPAHPDHGSPDAPRTDLAVLEALWERLARPFEVVGTLSALTGLSRPAIGELVGTAVATSPEAERLLAAFPRTVRSLATSMSTQAERCIGELRGPVLWSETLSARASSFGDPDLYICATPSRAYDIDENRVLVAALLAVRDAARSAVEHLGAASRYQDPEVRTAIRNGNDAGRAAEHPSLSDVTRGRPTPRALKRTRTGKKRASYEPAVAVLDRVGDPVAPVDLLSLCDRRTRAQHRALLHVLEDLEALGGELPELRAEAGSLFAGPVQFHHPGRAAERGGLSGIVVGQLLVDVPDRLAGLDAAAADEALAARSGARDHVVVRSADDVRRAVGRAVALAAAG